MLIFFVSIGLVLSKNHGVYIDEEYPTTVAYEAKQVVGDDTELNEDCCLIVSENKENIENFFVSFVGKYYLYSTNVVSIESLVMSDEEFNVLLKLYDYVVLIDNHYTFKAFAKELLVLDLKPGVYPTAYLLKVI